MDLQTSHLAAALMSGNNVFNVAQQEPSPATTQTGKDESKKEKPYEAPKETTFEEKEEMGSGEEFSDEVNNNLYS